MNGFVYDQTTRYESGNSSIPFVFPSSIRVSVGRQEGESAGRVAGQEVLRRRECRALHAHVHPDPSGGKSDGVEHSASTRAEDGDPGEQSHRRSGKERGKIREEQGNQAGEIDLYLLTLITCFKASSSLTPNDLMTPDLMTGSLLSCLHFTQDTSEAAHHADLSTRLQSYISHKQKKYCTIKVHSFIMLATW